MIGFIYRLDWGESITLQNTDERWKWGRRMLHESLNKGVLPQYHPRQERQVQILLLRLIETPATFESLQDELVL